MKVGTYLVFLSGIGALAFAACFPIVDYKEDDETNPSSTTSSSGGNGGMGQGGSASSGGIGGEIGGGGAGGEGGCTFGVIGDCGSGNKCALLDEDAGPAGGTECQTAGIRQAFTVCNTSADCQDGLFCDRFNNICQPICAAGPDCTAPGSDCIVAVGPSMGAVPGVNICSANCHPISGAPCSAAFGLVSCYRTTFGWECGSSTEVTQGKMEDEACSISRDCVKGLGCFGTAPDTTCRPWCSSPTAGGNDATCPGAEACFILSSNPAFHNAIEYGVCF